MISRHLTRFPCCIRRMCISRLTGNTEDPLRQMDDDSVISFCFFYPDLSVFLGFALFC